LIEGGKIAGIKICIKVSQDNVHNTQIVRFKTRGSRFELVGVEEPLQSTAIVVVDRELPAVSEPVKPPLHHLDEPSAAPEHEPSVGEGSSAIELKVCRGESSTYNYEDRDDHLCQALTSPVILVTNPTDSRVAVTEFWVDIADETGTYCRCPSRVGVTYQSYNGRYETNFSETTSFDVDAHSSVELVFEGTMKVDALGRSAYNGRPFNARIHTAFPNPLKAIVHLRFVTCRDCSFNCSGPF
jgi:hypothetical protein